MFINKIKNKILYFILFKIKKLKVIISFYALGMGLLKAFELACQYFVFNLIVNKNIKYFT